MQSDEPNRMVLPESMSNSSTNYSYFVNRLESILYRECEEKDMNYMKDIMENEPHCVNEQNNDGECPLILACMSDDNMEIFKLLLNHPNIDVNKQDKIGQTALMKVCGYHRHINDQRNIEKIKLLLEHPNIDINKQDDCGNTALNISMYSWDGAYNLEAVELLLEHPNTNVNHQNTFGETALMILSRRNSEVLFTGHSDYYSRVIKLLLDRADINVNLRNHCGATALMYACDENYGYCDDNENIANVVKLLLDHKCIDISICDTENDNVIDIAISRYIDNDLDCRVKIVDMLVNFSLDKYLCFSTKTLGNLIGMGNRYIESLLSNILSPLNFDRNLVLSMLKNCYDMPKYIYYCDLHINIKKRMLKDISNHKKELYYMPRNIFALCSEINFKLKFKTKKQVFDEIDDKLKFIFDIKDESDMIDKVSFYLCDDM